MLILLHAGYTYFSLYHVNSFLGHRALKLSCVSSSRAINPSFLFSEIGGTGRKLFSDQNASLSSSKRRVFAVMML